VPSRSKDNCRMVSLWEGRDQSPCGKAREIHCLHTYSFTDPKISLLLGHIGDELTTNERSRMYSFADPSQGGSGHIPVEQASRSTPL
jgi:hypothetical protein